METSKLRVDIWSDIACPWCYVGKRRLEAALARFPQRDAVEITWRAFELDPSAPRVRDTSKSHAERLAEKYGMTVKQAEERTAQLTELAAKDGLDFRFDRAKSGNTFDAHRVLHFAQERGLQDAVKERFFRGYLTDGEAIGEPEVLVRLAAEVGLPADEVQGVLAGDAYKDAVRADQALAQQLGIRGVPFFVFGEKYAVSGAQPAEHLLGALTQAWGERPAPALDEGAVCGPDGCA